jgi:hypothetical protein
MLLPLPESYSWEKKKTGPANRAGAFFDGNILVVRNGYVFPPICVVTGSHVDGSPIKQKLRQPAKVEPSLSLPLVSADLLSPKNKGYINFYLDPKLQTKRRTWLIINWVIFILSFALCLSLPDLINNGWGFISGPILWVVTIVIYFWKVWLLYASKVTTSYVWIRGLKPEIAQAIYAAGNV